MLRNSLKECQSKLKQSMYKDAEDNYRVCLIKKKATETAIKDLKQVNASPVRFCLHACASK
jgi:hypothetical protein